MYSVILNRSFLQVKVINHKRAVKLLLSGRQHACPCYDYQLFSLSEWQHVAPNLQDEKDRYLLTVRGKFYVPRLIYLPKGKLPQTSPRLTRWNLYVRDKGRCQYCGRTLSRREATRDHVRPLSLGGKTEWTNVVLCCRQCNQRKGNRTLSQLGWKQVIPKVPTWLELISWTEKKHL